MQSAENGVGIKSRYLTPRLSRRTSRKLSRILVNWMSSLRMPAWPFPSRSLSRLSRNTRNSTLSTVCSPFSAFSILTWLISSTVDGVFYCAKFSGQVFKKQGFGNLIITSSISAHIVNVPVDQPVSIPFATHFKCRSSLT